MNNDALHVQARDVVQNRAKSGSSFDKKLLRYNDIVQMANFYAALGGGGESAIPGLLAGIDMCDRTSAIYDPKSGPLDFIRSYSWMLPTEENIRRMSV